MSYPQLGLVCLTSDRLISYQTLTKTRFDKLSSQSILASLRVIYKNNINMFTKAINYCALNLIPLYRVTSHLFPFYETTEGETILLENRGNLTELGLVIKALNIRVVIHPDQYIVLSSDNSEVISNSVNELKHHGKIFDLIGLSQTPFNLINIHGGKKNRRGKLIETINTLPDNVKSRLTLENDEYCYSTKTLGEVSKETGVPVLFDFHHSLVHNQCESYQDPRIASEYELAADTWQNSAHITTHISNGESGLLDRKHSDFISDYPDIMTQAPWVEVEAKLKEESVKQLSNLLQVNN